MSKGSLTGFILTFIMREGDLMAYIYKIYNDINDKLYIGKTEFTIEKRFKEHCNDCLRERCEKRPLYNAMRKYGTKHFFIELIEETNNPEEREIYWIKQYDSYHNGYNATLGGDSKRYIDYNEVLDLWNQGLDCKEISKKIGHCVDSIQMILTTKGITEKEKRRRCDEKMGKAVYQIDKKYR